MRYNLGKCAVGAVAGMMMFAGLANPAAAATVIASPGPVNVGSNVTFTVSDDLDDLIAFDAGFVFDTTLLQLLSAAPGSNLPGSDDPNNYFFSDLGGGLGFLTFAGTAGFTGNDATIFTATFQTLAAGTANFVAAGDYYQDASGNAVPFQGIGSVTVSAVSAVPEPGTWLMMIVGFGLVGVAIRSQRGRQHAIA